MRAGLVALIVVALAAAGGAAYFANRMASSAVPESGEAARAPVAIPDVQVLVAAADIAPGDVLSGGAVRWLPWPSEAVRDTFVALPADEVRGGADALEARLDELAAPFVGKVARRPIAEGQPLTQDMVFARGEANFLTGALDQGMRAVAVPVSAETGAAGFVLPGDRVDVIVSHDITQSVPRDLQGSIYAAGMLRHAADTVVSDVLVLAADQAIAPSDDEKAQIAKTVTLQVSPEQAEAIAVAQSMGEVSLSLRGLGDRGRAARAGFTADTRVSRSLSRVIAAVRNGDKSKPSASEARAAPRPPKAAPQAPRQPSSGGGWRVSVHRGTQVDEVRGK